jgi:ribosomal-protein-alanine N-acetyltransferase
LLHKKNKLGVFKTKRLVLKPITEKDYDVWLDAYTNRMPAQNKWDSGPLPKAKCSKRAFKKIVRKLEQLAKSDDYYRYYIFERKTGNIVGQIDFDVFVRSTHQFANFGYQIFNHHWGKGYGQEASLMGLKIGFRQLKLNRLEAAINLDNRKSIQLAKAIGMRREGIKKRYWFENGKWVDHLIYVANPEDLGLAAQSFLER